MKEKRNCFSRNLRYYRKEAGFTQEELGARIAYSDKAISKWESGHVFPPIEALLQLSDVLKVPIDSFFASRKPVTYYLGVDGGGTKTKLVLADGEGTILKETILGPCNAVNMEVGAIRKVLKEGIDQVCGSLPRDQISAFFGLAGITFASTDKLELIFKGFGFASVGWGADAENTISAGLHGRDGMIAIMGTGSAVFASKGGQLKRFGGYGHLLGDYASGYEIGKEGLYAILNDENGSGPQTLMKTLFEKQTGKKINEVLMEFYEKGKPYIASFAPMVFEACRAGDVIARRILEENVARFSVHIKGALALFEGAKEIPLVFSGSITKGMDVLKPMLESNLKNKPIQIEILAEDPALGAVRLARLSGGKLDEN